MLVVSFPVVNGKGFHVAHLYLFHGNNCILFCGVDTEWYYPHYIFLFFIPSARILYCSLTFWFLELVMVLQILKTTLSSYYSHIDFSFTLT